MTVTLPNDASPYRFGLNITDFYACDRCGVWVAAVWHDEDRTLGVVNVPVLDDRALFCASVTFVDFEGEDVPAREMRRRIRWTPAKVIVLGGGA